MPTNGVTGRSRSRILAERNRTTTTTDRTRPGASTGAGGTGGTLPNLNTANTGAAADAGRRRVNEPRPQSSTVAARVGPDIVPDVFGGDGTPFPKAATLDDRLMQVNALALREAGQPAPFDAVNDAKA